MTGLFTYTFIVNAKIETATQTRHYTLPFVSLRPIRFTDAEMCQCERVRCLKTTSSTRADGSVVR